MISGKHGTFLAAKCPVILVLAKGKLVGKVNF